MEKLNKSIKTFFAWALGLSVGLPIGILGIIFGAINMFIPMLVLGIILTVLGVYVMPILWVKFGERMQDRTLMYMIEKEYIYTVGGLARQTGIAERDIRGKINRLILTNVLTGYLFIDDTLVSNRNEPQEKRKKPSPQRKCPNCAATMIFDGEQYKCEYCEHAEIFE